MIAAWRLPGARFVTVEAQEESVRLARKSASYNGLEARYEIRRGDFRDPALIGRRKNLTLCWAARPTFRQERELRGTMRRRLPADLSFAETSGIIARRRRNT